MRTVLCAGDYYGDQKETSTYREAVGIQGADTLPCTILDLPPGDPKRKTAGNRMRKCM